MAASDLNTTDLKVLSALPSIQGDDVISLDPSRTSAGLADDMAMHADVIESVLARLVKRGLVAHDYGSYRDDKTRRYHRTRAGDEAAARPCPATERAEHDPTGSPTRLPYPHAQNDCAMCRERDADVLVVDMTRPVALCAGCFGRQAAQRVISESGDRLDEPVTIAITVAPNRRLGVDHGE